MGLKMREFLCKNGHITEDLVEDEVKAIKCPSCNDQAKRVLSPVTGYVKDPQRTAAQLRRRSEEHSRSKSAIDEARYQFEKTCTKIEKKAGVNPMKAKRA